MIGGLIVATFTTLLFVPVVFSLLRRKPNPFLQTRKLPSLRSPDRSRLPTNAMNTPIDRPLPELGYANTRIPLLPANPGFRPCCWPGDLRPCLASFLCSGSSPPR